MTCLEFVSNSIPKRKKECGLNGKEERPENRKNPLGAAREPSFCKGCERGIYHPILSPVYVLEMSNIHLSEDSLKNTVDILCCFDFYKVLHFNYS